MRRRLSTSWCARASILLVLLLQPRASLAQIVISNDDITPDQVSRESPLVGYRKLSTDVFVSAGSDIGIPVSVYIEAAKRTPALHQLMTTRGITADRATTRDWLRTLGSLP